MDSDASEHSYGGYILQKLGNVIAHGTFDREEQGRSSTHRELAAVRHMLDSFSHLLRHQVVLWRSDNVGSTKDHLQALALDIFRMCLTYDIQLISKWVPREENQLVDSISKYYDTDNWSIDDESFNFIHSQFGPFTIDRFATASNRKLPRFDSRFHCPGAENVNTFTSHWGNDFNWLCPPIALVGDTLKHARLCKAAGVICSRVEIILLLAAADSKWEDLFPFVKHYALLDPYFTNQCGNTSVFTGYATFHSIAFLTDFGETFITHKSRLIA